jgi:UDP-glucuronate 4-epimerase
MKKVIVTGAAGFIGFHLAKALKKRGDTVLGIDNYNSYYSPKLKRLRGTLLKEDGIEVREGDLCNQEILTQAIEDFKPTHLVHLAAQAGVRYSTENPTAYVDSNIHAFLNVLEACRKNPHIPLTFASSSSVYGTNTKVPFSETDLTDHPASFYGATKKANELMAFSYHHMYGIKATGLRFFTVYGPLGRPDMAYYSFAECITQGKPINVYNHGNMERDFTYISDIVDGVIAALDLGASWEIFNLGNHSPVKLMEMIELLESLLGKKAEKNFLKMQTGDVLITYADISHSKQKLGFSPKTPIAQGLTKFIEWYQEFITSCK